MDDRQTSKTKINILREGAAGLIMGFSSTFSIIFSAMIIFNGALRQYLPMGVSVALVTAIIVVFIIGLKSSLPIMMATTQIVYFVITSVILNSINSQLQIESPNIDPLPTLITAFSTLTLFFGITLYFLGKFNLGNLIRFIPYPVICGFLASFGWLCFKSGFTTITNIPVTWIGLPSLFHSPLLLLALIALGYAFISFIITYKYTHPLVILGMIIFALLVFYLYLFLQGISLEKAYKLHLVLQNPKSVQTATLENYFPFIMQWNWQSLNIIQWHLLFNNILQYFILMIMGAINCLLLISSIEISVRQDLDVNKEMKNCGIANILTGAIGGFVGFQSQSMTNLNNFWGVKTRFAGMVCLAVYVCDLALGSSLLSVFPTVISGFLIFYSAFIITNDWLILSWKRFDKFDFLIVLTIFLSIACIDLLTGFVIGLILAVILFAMKYSKIKIISAAVDGCKLKSNVERAPYQEQLLKFHGNQEYILVLKGFLFFGNINLLVETIKHRFIEKPSCKFLILDCFSISGLDSSAILGFSKIIKLTKEHHICLVFCALSSLIQKEIEKALKEGGETFKYQTFDDLDHGLEWVENQILYHEETKQSNLSASTDMLRKTIESIKDLGSYFERISFKPQEIIYNKGDDSNGFFYIESGRVEVTLPNVNKKHIRIRSMQAGTIIGEIGMYLGRNRTAEVRSTEPCVLLFMSQEKLKALTEAAPDLAELLDRQIIHILANRLQYTNQLLEAFKASMLGSPVDKGVK